MRIEAQGSRDGMKVQTAFKICAVFALMIVPQISFAGDDCYDLWYARNEIYKRNGYCFQTRLAMETFGNGSCYTRAPRFTRTDQLTIEAIRRKERQRNCRVN
jgi:hypothetical protein